MALFQSFWFGSELPRWSRACFRSFLDHGHSVDLFAYRRLDVPRGVRLCNAGKVLPRDMLFLYSTGREKGGVSGFSNLFRYKLLHDRGGWWVDADVICRAVSPPEVETFFALESPGFVGSAVLRLPARSELAAELLRRATAAGSGVRWGQTGPKLLTKVVDEMGNVAAAASTYGAFPIHYSEHRKLVSAAARAEVDHRVASSPFVHLWNEMFRRDQSIDLGRPEAGSFMDAIYRQHQEIGRSGPREWLRSAGRRIRFALNLAGCA